MPMLDGVYLGEDLAVALEIREGVHKRIQDFETGSSETPRLPPISLPDSRNVACEATRSTFWSSQIGGRSREAHGSSVVFITGRGDDPAIQLRAPCLDPPHTSGPIP